VVAEGPRERVVVPDVRGDIVEHHIRHAEEVRQRSPLHPGYDRLERLLVVGVLHVFLPDVLRRLRFVAMGGFSYT
jgi:hypothetical protein